MGHIRRKGRKRQTDVERQEMKGETWADRCGILHFGRVSLCGRGTHSILPRPTAPPLQKRRRVGGSGAKPMLKEACPWAV